MNKTLCAVILLSIFLRATAVAAVIPFTKDYSLMIPLDIKTDLECLIQVIPKVGVGAYAAGVEVPQGSQFVLFDPFITYFDANGTQLPSPGNFDDEEERFKSGETLLFIARTGSDELWNYSDGNRILTTYAFIWTVPKYTLTKSLLQEWLGDGFPTSHKVPSLWKKSYVTYSANWDEIIAVEDVECKSNSS